MALTLQDFAALVKTQALAVSSSCQQAIDTSVGSVVRALLEANASVGLWVQWLAVQVLSTTRAATSTGSDLDSWMADFNLVRFPAISASGTVTFSRASNGVAALVLPGSLIRTGLSASDQVFVVISDQSHPSWNGSGYMLMPSDFQIDCPVVAQVAGVLGNVVAGSVRTLASAMPGIDAVTNQLPIVGGMDAETDAALRARFAGFLSSQNRATSQAVTFAIAGIGQGVSSTVADRVDTSGVIRPGHFTVTVDDGTGTPGSDFLSKVADVVDAVRPIGATFSVRPPLVIPLNVQLQVTGTTAAQSAIRASIVAYIASLPIGATLSLTRLYQIAYSTDSSISNASDALINGVAADYVPPANGLLRPSTVTVNP